MAKKGLEKFVEETYAKLTPEQKEAFEKHLKYASPESRRKMKLHEFENLKIGEKKVGTQEFFQQHYHATKEFAAKNKLHAKTDDNTINQILEKYIIEALSNLGPAEREDAEFYKARLESEKFEGPKEKLQELYRLAHEHLGMSNEEFSSLVSRLKSGDEDGFYEALGQVSDSLADRLIQLRVEKHRENVAEKHGKKSFNVYLLTQMKEKYKHRIKKDELSDAIMTDPSTNIQRYHGIKGIHEKKHLKPYMMEEAPKEEYKKPA
ncbi:MAG: hypothetical protein V1743_07135 [Nanoarchaeota archaeon]